MSGKTLKIIIDADGSPVKKEALQVAEKFDLQILIVTTTDHFENLPDISPKAHYIYVDAGPDAVDYRIVAEAEKGDLVITQDYGLASLLIPQVKVLHHSGREFTTENLPFLLQSRHDSQLLRKAGKRTKGPAKFTAADRKHFKQEMTGFVKNMLEL